MKFNRDNKSIKYVIDIKDRYTIGDTSIKLSRGLVKMIDGFIEHIKRYKKVYMTIVKYVSLCMFIGVLPELFKWIQSNEFINIVQNIKNMTQIEILQWCDVAAIFIRKACGILAGIVCSLEIIKISINNRSKLN